MADIEVDEGVAIRQKLVTVLEEAMTSDLAGMSCVVATLRKLCRKHQRNQEVCEDDRGDMHHLLRLTDDLHCWDAHLPEIDGVELEGERLPFPYYG